MDLQTLKNILEAVLMSAEKPLDMRHLEKLFEEDDDQPSKDEIRQALSGLQEDYQGRGLQLKEVASGYRMQVNQDYATWVARLWEEKPPRYSRALLETLVLIAYRQPITRGEIEEIRGVSVSSHIVKTLAERDWIRVLGHKDVPGKPAMYGTTPEFLNYFDLKTLDELPALSDIKDLDKLHPELALGDEEAAKDGSVDADVDAKEDTETGAEASTEVEASQDDMDLDGADQDDTDHQVRAMETDAEAATESGIESEAGVDDPSEAADSTQMEEADSTDAEAETAESAQAGDYESAFNGGGFEDADDSIESAPIDDTDLSAPLVDQEETPEPQAEADMAGDAGLDESSESEVQLS